MSAILDLRNLESHPEKSLISAGASELRSAVESTILLPPLPENWPYEVEYVDRRLTLPGLKIVGPLPSTDYFLELMQGDHPLINRPLLEQFGFILFENCLQDARGFSLRKKGPQLPHKDVVKDSSGKMTEVISLNSHPEENLLRREAYTLVGEEIAVLKALIQFFQRYKEDFQDEKMNIRPRTRNLIFQLLGDVEKGGGLKGIDLNKFYSSDLFEGAYRLWKNILFKNQHGKNYQFSREAFLHFPKMEELYAFLAQALYFHDWKPNQRLLIDNRKMVHAGVSKTMQVVVSNTIIVTKDYIWTPEGKLKDLNTVISK